MMRCQLFSLVLILLLAGGALAPAQTAPVEVTGDPSRLQCRALPQSGRHQGMTVVEVRNRGRHVAEPLCFELTRPDGFTLRVWRAAWPWTARLGRPVRPSSTERYLVTFWAEPNAGTVQAKVVAAAFWKGRVPRKPECPVTITSKGETEVRDPLSGHLERMPSYELTNAAPHPVDVTLVLDLGGGRNQALPVVLRLEPESTRAFHGTLQTAGAPVRGIELPDWCAVLEPDPKLLEEAVALVRAADPTDWSALDVPGEGTMVELGGKTRALLRAEDQWHLVTPGEGAGRLTGNSDLSDLLPFLVQPSWQDPTITTRARVASRTEQRLCLHLGEGPWPLSSVNGRDGTLWLEDGKLTRLGRHEPERGSATSFSQYLTWECAEDLPGKPPRRIRLMNDYGDRTHTVFYTSELEWKAVGERSRLMTVRTWLAEDRARASTYRFDWDQATVAQPAPAPRPRPEAPGLRERLRKAWDAAHRYPGDRFTFSSRLALVLPGTSFDWNQQRRVEGRWSFSAWTGRASDDGGPRHGEAQAEITSLPDTDVRRGMQDLLIARYSILSRQVPAGWPDFETAFGKSHLSEGAGGIILCEGGPIAEVRLHGGLVKELKHAKGLRHEYTWQKLGEKFVASRVVTLDMPHRPVLEVSWKTVSGVVLPERWVITDWFHDEFGPEEYRLSEMRLTREE